MGDAVVRAIREDVGEIVLNRRPVKPLILLNAIAPGAASRPGALTAIRESMERMRKARERYDAAQSSPGDSITARPRRPTPAPHPLDLLQSVDQRKEVVLT